MTEVIHNSPQSKKPLTLLKPRLGVNIDHVATLRQARKSQYPNPIDAALLVERAGADFITLHLREDRRHIQDADVWELKRRQTTTMNLEIAVTSEMIDFALKLQPFEICLVPENRLEVTTEGGLNVYDESSVSFKTIQQAVHTLKNAGIRVSLFIDPEIKAVEYAHQLGASIIELHTGRFSHDENNPHEHERLRLAAQRGQELGMTVNAGHGLNLQNLPKLLPHVAGLIHDYNIGHALISDAVFIGLEKAVESYRRVLGIVD